MKQRFINNGAALLTVAFTTLAAQLATAGSRPISDFVSVQGHWCIGGFDNNGNPICPGSYGALGCGALFVPPAPNFIGWSQPPNAVRGLPQLPFIFLSMDYAGEIDRFLGGALGTTVTGTLDEVANPDGTATVAVTLHAHNALTFASLCNAPANQCDFANTPLVFGARLSDVLRGAAPSLGDCTFYVKFINTAPGAPLPDLLQMFYCPGPGQGPALTLSFFGQANGTLACPKNESRSEEQPS